MQMSDTKRIAFITGTRAEWGLLSPVAKALAATDGIEVKIVATNMHLMPRYGNTVDEIVADGFDVAERVPMDDTDGSELRTVEVMAQCLKGMAEAFDRLKPDRVVILGDRFEMLSAATAALMMRIPIIHIAGGETTLGAIDDSIRHAITEMSWLHLTATEPYRRRVIAMGAAPERVINTGAIGVYNALNEPLMSRDELAASVGLDFERPTLLVTYHAATADDRSPVEQFQALLDALDRHGDVDVLITYPNNDPRGGGLVTLIEQWVKANSHRAVGIPSLGKTRYLSALRYVDAVVGNSSSGIVEVPSMHIPTVNIGTRQEGRISGESVVHCGVTADEIDRAIAYALSDEGREKARRAANPYYRPDTLGVMVKAIAGTL